MEKEIEVKNWEKLPDDTEIKIEVGYCTLTEDGMRTKDKLILNRYSDHFLHHEGFIDKKPPLPFSMDVLLDGYIRLFNNRKTVLTWENRYDWLVSSFSLEEMED